MRVSASDFFPKTIRRWYSNSLCTYFCITRTVVTPVRIRPSAPGAFRKTSNDMIVIGYYARLHESPRYNSRLPVVVAVFRSVSDTEARIIARQFWRRLLEIVVFPATVCNNNIRVSRLSSEKSATITPPGAAQQHPAEFNFARRFDRRLCIVNTSSSPDYCLNYEFTFENRRAIYLPSSRFSENYINDNSLSRRIRFIVRRNYVRRWQYGRNFCYK